MVDHDTRIFSPHTVPRACVTIGHQVNEFNSFYWLRYESIYRFEHIVAFRSGKVMAKSADSSQLPFTNGRPLECDYFQPFQGFLFLEEISSFLTAQGPQFDRLYRRRFGRTAITHIGPRSNMQPCRLFDRNFILRPNHGLVTAEEGYP